MTLWSMTPVSKQAKLVNRVTGRPWTGTGAGRTPKNNFLRSDSVANGRPKVHNYEVMLTSPLVAVTAFLIRVSSTLTGSREVSAADRARVTMPDDFRDRLNGELTPGVTLVVTADSLRAGETGKSLTVIEADT